MRYENNEKMYNSIEGIEKNKINEIVKNRVKIYLVILLSLAILGVLLIYIYGAVVIDSLYIKKELIYVDYNIELMFDPFMVAATFVIPYAFMTLTQFLVTGEVELYCIDEIKVVAEIAEMGGEIGVKAGNIILETSIGFIDSTGLWNPVVIAFFGIFDIGGLLFGVKDVSLIPYTGKLGGIGIGISVMNVILLGFRKEEVFLSVLLFIMASIDYEEPILNYLIKVFLDFCNLKL
jgi:hypothetical protein